MTWEDAPETLAGWTGQRARWMKGWMQTFIVHNRHPRQLLADLGWRRFLAFEIIVAGIVLAPLLHTGFVIACLIALALGGIVLPRFDLWSLSCLSVLGLGYGVAMATNCVGLLRTGQPRLIAAQLALPAYWVLIAWATMRGLHDLTWRPFHWAKTNHHPAVLDIPTVSAGRWARLWPKFLGLSATEKT